MKFEISGYNLNNLIKTLNSKNIVLTNVQYSKNKITFETDDKNEKKVKRYIANFKVNRGLTKSNKIKESIISNIGIIIGCFVGVLFYLFSSNYTWGIEIYGLEKLSKQEILLVLETNNVKIGKINLQTSKDIEEILLNNYIQIAQVSVIRIGTSIIINLSEKLVYDNSTFKPITAKHCGTIKSVEVETGTLNVKVGDYVNAGDILVLPFNLDDAGNKISVQPKAKITAEMFIFERCELKKEEIVLVETGKTIVTYNYKFKNLKLFSGKNKNSFALFDFVVYNENVSTLIPFNREVVVYKELTTSIKINDFENEKQNLKDRSLSLAKSKVKNEEILDEKTEITLFEDKMIACSCLRVVGQIND